MKNKEYMKENICIYRNDLNKVIWFNFTALDQDLFLSLCIAARNKGTGLIQLNFSDLKSLAHINKNMTSTEFANKIKQLNYKITNMKVSYETENEFACFALFITCIADKDERTVSIRVHPDLVEMLNDITKNFTMFDMNVFTSIKFKHAKTLYRILAQYRRTDGTGWWNCSIQDVRELFCVPDSTKEKYIARDVIKPAVRELSKIYDKLKFSIVKDSRKKGSPVIGFKFEFSEKSFLTKKDKSNEVKEVRDETAYNAEIGRRVRKGKNKRNQFNQFTEREVSSSQISDLERRLLNKN